MDALAPDFLGHELKVYDLAFADSATGWAVGGDGLVLRHYPHTPTERYTALSPADLLLWDASRDGLVDAGGTVYFSVPTQGQVLRLTPAGRLESHLDAESMHVPGERGDRGIALHTPQALGLDRRGDLYVGHFDSRRLVRITPDSVVSLVASGAPRPSWKR
ncbi:MAG: hypothetical protein AB1505_12705 [Candidatus Latescibacterota bacterium]